MLFFYRDMHNEKYPISLTNRPTPPTFCNTQRMGFFFEEKWFLAPKFEIPGKTFPLYWFRNLDWLIYKSALCTGIALLPRWGPKSHKCVQRLHELTISTKNRVSKWVYCWNFENQPFLPGSTIWFNTQAVTTARMNSEITTVSESVYDYSDDKYVPTAACVENWIPRL